MAVVMLPLDSTSGSPSFSAQATRQAFSVLAGPAPAGRPLGARSGVRQGTPTTTATLSGGGSMTWNVDAHSGVLDTQTSASAGPYFYATDGADTGSVTAANASNPRIDILYVKVNDNPQDGSGLYSGQVLYLAGTAAASPVQPATPSRGMVLARINVPTSGGGAPTITWIAPSFVHGAGANLIQVGFISGISSGGALASGASITINVTIPIPLTFLAPSIITGQLISLGTATSNFLVIRQGAVDFAGATAILTLTNVGTASVPAFSGLSVTWMAAGTPI